MDLYGDLTVPGNGIWLAWYQAWALLETGDTQTSRELVDRIIAFVDNAVANGAPEYQHQLLARCHLLLGEHDEAVRLLEKSWTHFGINWREMAGHWWQPLAAREDFQQLKARILAHADSERAKLGWPPASFDP